MSRQKTLNDIVSFKGVGLHTGLESTIYIKPSNSDTGIVFRDFNDPNKSVVANIKNVKKTNRGTTISSKNFEVNTIEHLMSALYSHAIDNVLIEIDGNEVPILDGSAKNFYDSFEKVGIKILEQDRQVIEIDDGISIVNDDAFLKILPYDGFKITFEIEFPECSIKKQKFVLETLNDYRNEIAPCRTFCTFSEVIKLQKSGLSLGGNFDNAIVYLDDSISDEQIDDFNKNTSESVTKNNIGLKTYKNKKLLFENEAVRHKILDLIGDLSLIGKEIRGHIISKKSGHFLNTEFAKKIDSKQKTNKFKYNRFEIEKIIPHRDPFLLIDEIVDGKLGEYVCAVKYVSEKESYFKGHFPGNPIMPGVLIIECMAQTSCFLSLKTVGSPENKLMLLSVIKSSKFIKKVVPGDKLFLRVELIKFRLNNALIKGIATVDDELVAEAEWMATVVDKYENS
tara:strand:- start:2573 stop:3928 length:1356 start_codon:yes stop_codon:yes gene_type:complete